MSDSSISYDVFHYGDDVIKKSGVTRFIEKSLKYKNNTIWASDLDFVLDGTKIFSRENKGCYIIAKQKEQPLGSLCMCNISYWIVAEQNDRPGIDRDHLLPKMIWERYANKNDVAVFGDLLTIENDMKDQISTNLVESMEKYCKENDYSIIYLHVHSDPKESEDVSFWQNLGYKLILRDQPTLHFEKIL